MQFQDRHFQLFYIVKKEEEKCGRLGYQNYLSYTLQRNIDNFFYLYEASVRRY